MDPQNRPSLLIGPLGATHARGETIQRLCHVKLQASSLKTTHTGKNLRIGITGSPGTGKKTVGRMLSEFLGLEFLSINEFAIKNRFGKKIGRGYVIDTGRLYRKIKTRGRVVSGHLLPYVIPSKDLDWVIVLRCSPRVLRTRYESRHYSQQKILENVEAEMIGLIAAACLETYPQRKIAEFDTSRAKPETIARRAVEVIKGDVAPSFDKIDWLSASSPSAFVEALRGKYNRLNIPKKITRFAKPKAHKK